MYAAKPEQQIIQYAKSSFSLSLRPKETSKKLQVFVQHSVNGTFFLKVVHIEIPSRLLKTFIENFSLK